MARPKKQQNQIQEKESSDKTEIVWEAPEYEFNNKDVSWYWISFIVAIILVVIAFWQKNFLFAVFIVVAEVFLIYFANRFPPIWKFKINEKGIHIGEEKFYEFNKIECFDIDEQNEEFSELIFKLKSKLGSYIKIFIHKEDQGKIETYLAGHLPKKELPPSFIDSLGKLAGF